MLFHRLILPSVLDCLLLQASALSRQSTNPSFRYLVANSWTYTLYSSHPLTGSERYVQREYFSWPRSYLTKTPASSNLSRLSSLDTGSFTRLKQRTWLGRAVLTDVYCWGKGGARLEGALSGRRWSPFSDSWFRSEICRAEPQTITTSCFDRLAWKRVSLDHAIM